MRSRYPSPSSFSYSFGPGPLTPAIKALVMANIAMFVVSLVAPAITLSLGLRPADVVGQLHLWQPFTYMFLHSGIFHILFNCWRCGCSASSSRRMWGSRFFVNTTSSARGRGGDDARAGVHAVFIRRSTVSSLTIGASGASTESSRLRVVFSGSTDLHVSGLSIPANIS